MDKCMMAWQIMDKHKQNDDLYSGKFLVEAWMAAAIPVAMYETEYLGSGLGVLVKRDTPFHAWPDEVEWLGGCVRVIWF